jgi:hypothetical protein
MEVLSGILPIAKSTTSEIGSIWASEEETTSGWNLTGHGEPYVDCGTIRFRGCLNVAGHHQALDREQNGKAFVQAYRRSCGRKECPICRESWAGLEAGRVEFRLSYYAGKWRQPIHVSVNPDPILWGMDFADMRSKAYKVLKRVGIVGGSMIYHPFRQNVSKKWFFSPHFHVIGYGWHNGFHVAGWVVKNHGVRKSVHATVMYQLSHAGVHKYFHTVTWFGELSYNKLKAPILVEEKPKCPLCGLELVPLIYVGEGKVPPPIEEGDYFLDSCDWIEHYGRWG